MTNKSAVLFAVILCAPRAAQASQVSSGTDVLSGEPSLIDVLKTPLGVSLADFSKMRPSAGSFSFEKPGSVDLALSNQVLFERFAGNAFETITFNFVDGKLIRIAALGDLPKERVRVASESLLKACDSLWGTKRFLGAYRSERNGETSQYVSNRWLVDGKRGDVMFKVPDPDSNSIFVVVSVIDLSSHKEELAKLNEKRLTGKSEQRILRAVGLRTSKSRP